MTVKERLRRAIESLPEDVRMEEALSRFHLLYKIEQGIEQDEARDTVSQEEAEKRIARWLR